MTNRFIRAPRPRRLSAPTLRPRASVLALILVFACVCPAIAQTTPPPASTKATEAVHDLFVRSDLDAARAAAQQALADSHPNRQSELGALFVQMETAALQANTGAELEAALRLCELLPASDDPRVSIAASRILDVAANTSEFRAVVPRIRTLVTQSGTRHLSTGAASAIQSDLRAALIAAAADGAPGLSVVDLAHDSGLITDWRIAGPFGSYPNVAFEDSFAPERDQLTQTIYESHAVERFRFENGEVRLPEYFSTSGVFYAAAQVSVVTAGNWLLRVESPGTIQAWMDGAPILTKDDRFRSTAETAGAMVALRPGSHTVLVKFLPSAVPFRVALVPQASRSSSPQELIASDVEREYIAAAQAFWAGDYATAIDKLTSMRAGHDSAAVDLLLAKAWSRANTGEESVPLLHATLKAATSAHAAEYELAARAFAEERFADSFDAARLVLKSSPRFEPAAFLLASSAAKLNWQSEAAPAFEKEVALHPSCAVLQQASRFLAGISDYARADKYESQLAACAPASLAWATALAASGRHAESASAAQQVVAAHPLDRAARELLVRQLALAGRVDEARVAAHELSQLAPNSREYTRWSNELNSGNVLLGDSSEPEAAAQPFYAPFRREGVAVVKQNLARDFSGQSAVFLLDDHIAQLRDNGSASLYVHKITRVLDADGIAEYGEVTVPSNADIVELRTLKADGTIVEPELSQNKSSISMPALAAGDAIDLEYVIRDLYGGIADNPEVFQFAFGHFAAPIVLSRFVLLSPGNVKLNIVASGDVPSVDQGVRNGVVTRVWEADNLPRYASEISMPREGVLPLLRIYPELKGGWAGVRDFYRDEFIQAAHIGSRVEAVARGIPAGTDEQRLRAAYRLVISRVRSSGDDYSYGNIDTAENTLASFSGSRTAALLALGNAIGIPADVLMARSFTPLPLSVPSPHAYTHPLLVFHVKARDGSLHDVLLEPASGGIGFGGIAATIDRSDALFVPIAARENPPLLTPVPRPLLDDHSLADGDVSFDAEGDLTAHIVIRMGAARGAQIRSTLNGIDPADRKHYFEQLASRIFPGTTEANGKVENENDPGKPLILIVDCRAIHFADFSGRLGDLDQLVPALGLSSMYATAKSRYAPLFIDTPLIETTTFRIHLPNGVQFAQPPRNFTGRSKFGSYSLTFGVVAPNTLEVRREFDVPVQVIATGRFSSFARFANDLDNAEQEKLGLRRVSAAALREPEN